MSTWTPPAESLPEPAYEPLYLVTLDWGFRRDRQLALARFYPAPGGTRPLWRLACWPHRVLSGVVVAWMPAPDLYEDAMAPAMEGGKG